MNPRFSSPDQLAALCREHRVDRLYLFGSAATDRFDEASSDFDFLVAFADQPPVAYAENYLAFADALETMSGRPIHLVTEKSMRNPYFKTSVLATRQLLYDRREQEAVA
jgi:predicted nucleotidyltransferase